jgi:hypothetical protein
MTEAVIFVAALTALAIAVVAALCGIVWNAPPQKQEFLPSAPPLE